MSADLLDDSARFVAASKRVTAALHDMERGLGTLTRGFISFRRATYRATLTPGERYLDGMCRKVRDERTDVATSARRLMVAADVAAQLDGRRRVA